MIEDLSIEQLLQKGREAYERDDCKAALRYLRVAERRAPAYADVHNMVGLCLNLLGDPEAAVESFDRAVRLNGRYTEALVNRALTLQELGRYDEAEQSFQLAAESDVEEGVARFPAMLAARIANRHAEVGDLYAAGGALEEAAEQYRRALEIRPRFADIRNRLGRTLIELGRPESAVQALEEALRVNPGFLEARINLGLARLRAGDRDGARREWLRCRDSDPGNAQVRTFLAML